MPKDNSIKSVLIIGSGPIVIGQACEFDYAGSQAARSIREEGIEAVSYTHLDVYKRQRLGDNEHNLILSKKVLPASSPPLISKATMLPPNFICFLAISYCGCDFKNGYFTKLTFGCCSKNSATFKAFSQCLSKRMAKVSKLLDNTHALNGDNEGPVSLENK